MIADRNRRQRRKPRRRGGGATCPSVASLGDYAGVNRLVVFQRGDLNVNKDGITGTPAREEDWSLDMTGNWPGFVQKTSGTTDLEQGRTHNPVNEITAITASTGTDWTDPVHDRNGNMTTIPKPANLADGLTAIYDAWNRLVEVKDGQTVIARYDYDGLNRRIKSHIDSGAPSNPTGIDSYVHYYHNSAWQILETRQSDTPSAQPETLQPKHQFVWSQRYIDAPVLRDENTGNDGLCDDERLYFLNDANFNVTALVDTAGDALERYVYSPYGVVTIYDATWINSRSASSYANVTLYTGRELDTETGLYYYRNRYYDAELGRFVSRDLIGYGANDVGLYRYLFDAPTTETDASGLQYGADPGYMGIRSMGRQIRQWEHEADAAKAKQLCASIDYCSEGCTKKGCTRESCEKSMTQFVKAVRDTWILGLGYWFGRQRYFGWNTCSRWTFDLINRLPKDFGDNDPCIRMAGLRIYHLSDTGLARDHIYYEVSMCDGSKINADNGAWGGRGHIFTGSDPQTWEILSMG